MAVMTHTFKNSLTRYQCLPCFLDRVSYHRERRKSNVKPVDIQQSEKPPFICPGARDARTVFDDRRTGALGALSARPVAGGPCQLLYAVGLGSGADPPPQRGGESVGLRAPTVRAPL